MTDPEIIPPRPLPDFAGGGMTPPVPVQNFPRYSRDNLPEGEWKTFRKKVNTEMVRIDGPFVVDTDEGPLLCRDGWLARDARGYPYPLAADEQVLIYEPVDEVEAQ